MFSIDKNYLFAFGVFEQMAKAIVDIFAISTGLNFQILRHRTGIQLDEAELDRWKQIWDKCNSNI